MASTLYMSESPAVRYASGAALYFAQGIPKGLLHIAMPAWLASQGASTGAIASYLAIIVLPWAFKLVTGPLMDRFAYRPMGGRRPWVLGAQFGLVLSLLSLAAIHDPIAQIGLLTMLGVIINTFTATQDVAVDGMAIDLVPESEHGRINAFMSCGKAVGWAVTAALSGTLLVKYGLAVTGAVAAAGAGLVLIAFFFVREREGERLLPWTQGEAVGQRRVASSFKDVLQDLNGVLWTRTSLVVSLIMFFDGVVTGYGEALMPIAAVKLFSFTTTQWSQLVAMMGLTGAFAALALGPLIDRFGARTMLLLTIGVVVCARVPAGRNPAPVDQQHLRAVHAVGVRPDAACHDGLRHRSRHEHLLHSHLGHAVRGLHVDGQPRPFRGLEDIRQPVGVHELRAELCADGRHRQSRCSARLRSFASTRSPHQRSQ